MHVDRVRQRRTLSFGTVQAVIDDAEQLASGDVETIGVHSFPAILEHLAKTNDMVVGKIVPPKMPLPYRLLMPLLRSRILNGPVQPGVCIAFEAIAGLFLGAERLEARRNAFASEAKLYGV